MEPSVKDLLMAIKLSLIDPIYKWTLPYWPLLLMVAEMHICYRSLWRVENKLKIFTTFSFQDCWKLPVIYYLCVKKVDYLSTDCIWYVTWLTGTTQPWCYHLIYERKTPCFCLFKKALWIYQQNKVTRVLLLNELQRAITDWCHREQQCAFDAVMTWTPLW